MQIQKHHALCISDKNKLSIDFLTYCYRVVLGVKQLSSVAKPPCFDSILVRALPPQFSYFYRAASLTNLNNCSCHSVPLGLLEYELGSLTVNLGLWLLLKLGCVSLRNSSERKNYGITWLKGEC